MSAFISGVKMHHRSSMYMNKLTSCSDGINVRVGKANVNKTSKAIKCYIYFKKTYTNLG